MLEEFQCSNVFTGKQKLFTVISMRLDRNKSMKSPPLGQIPYSCRCTQHSLIEVNELKLIVWVEFYFLLKNN